MTGIDTNILVRYFVGDDPLQSATSQDFVDERRKPELPGYISSIVVAEMVWVLITRYQLGREKVAAIVDGLLGNSSLVVEHTNEVAWALKEYRAGALDFSDALFAALEHFSCCWVSRKGRAVAFSVGKTPIRVAAPLCTYRKNALATSAGCYTTVTFDKQASRHAGFTLLA